MLRKIFALLLCFALLAVMAACANEPEPRRERDRDRDDAPPSRESDRDERDNRERDNRDRDDTSRRDRETGEQPEHSPLTFTKAGFSITLTSEFAEASAPAYTVYYESGTAGVAVLKEDFTMFEAAGVSTDITLNEYAQIVMSANDTHADINVRNGITYFEYERSISGSDFAYLVTVFKSGDAFWLVQFFSETMDYSGLRDDFFRWAASVEFDSVYVPTSFEAVQTRIIELGEMNALLSDNQMGWLTDGTDDMSSPYNAWDVSQASELVLEFASPPSGELHYTWLGDGNNWDWQQRFVVLEGNANKVALKLTDFADFDKFQRSYHIKIFIGYFGIPCDDPHDGIRIRDCDLCDREGMKTPMTVADLRITRAYLVVYE
jgi:hypothetical protein